MFAITSKGTKFPPFIILKSKYRVPNIMPSDVIVCRNVRGWMTKDLMLDWIKNIINNFEIPPKVKLVLVMDKCKVHMTDDKKLVWKFFLFQLD